MECPECGAERPRSGMCPECGAPAPRAYSSMRQWRGDNSEDQGSAGRRRRGKEYDWDAEEEHGAGASHSRGRGSRNAGEAARSGSSRVRGSSAANWNDGYDDEMPKPPAKSVARGRRPSPAAANDEYQEIDLERALVPSRNDLLPMDPSLGVGGVPALPGMTSIEEEERALGIRHPVYIPASDEKRKRKLSSWRVISGVLSVLVVVVAACGLGGTFLYQRVQTNIAPPIRVKLTTPAISTANVPVTPVATPGAQNKYIQHVITANGINNQYQAANSSSVTSHFTVGQTVFVLMQALNLSTFKGQTPVVQVALFLGNVNIGDSSKFTLVNGTGDNQCNFNTGCNVKFQFSNIPQTGVYTAKIYFNAPASSSSDTPADQYLAAMITFVVLPNTTGSTTPGTNASPGVSPSAKASSSFGVSPVVWRLAIAAA